LVIIFICPPSPGLGFFAILILPDRRHFSLNFYLPMETPESQPEKKAANGIKMAAKIC